MPTQPPSPERPSVPRQAWRGLREPGRARRGAPHSPSERNWGGSWRETSPQPGLPPSGKCQETGSCGEEGVQLGWRRPRHPRAPKRPSQPPRGRWGGEEASSPLLTFPVRSSRDRSGLVRQVLGGSEARLHLPLALFLSCSLSCSLRLCGCQSLSLSLCLRPESISSVWLCLSFVSACLWHPDLPLSCLTSL